MTGGTGRELTTGVTPRERFLGGARIAT